MKLKAIIGILGFILFYLLVMETNNIIIILLYRVPSEQKF